VERVLARQHAQPVAVLVLLQAHRARRPRPVVRRAARPRLRGSIAVRGPIAGRIAVGADRRVGGGKDARLRRGDDLRGGEQPLSVASSPSRLRRLRVVSVVSARASSAARRRERGGGDEARDERAREEARPVAEGLGRAEGDEGAAEGSRERRAEDAPARSGDEDGGDARVGALVVVGARHRDERTLDVVVHHGRDRARGLRVANWGFLRWG
jgi:hypothetical protein